MVCWKTIYRWLYSGRLMKDVFPVLRQKGKRHNPVENRGKFTVDRLFSQRPKEIHSGESFGQGS